MHVSYNTLFWPGRPVFSLRLTMAPDGIAPIPAFLHLDHKTRITLFGKTILTLLGFLLLSPILVACTLYRFTVSKVATWTRPDLSHILPLHATIFLQTSVQADICRNVLLRFRVLGRLDLATMKARFVERFVNAKSGNGNRGLKYPELKQYPVKWAGLLFWKWESDFKVEEHITHIEKTQLNLDSLEVQFLKTPFELEKSPWQILLVEDADSRGDDEPSFLILFKFHHALADGRSMCDALMECADEKVPTIQLHANTLQKSYLTRFFNWITFPIRAAYEFAKLAHLKSDDSRIYSPWTVDAADQSADESRERHVTRSRPLDKKRVKCLASQYGVSFTAILLAMVAGGVRTFLLRGGGTKKVEIPECMYCEVPLPVPDSARDGDRLTNSVCIVSFALPVGTADPLQRVALCEQSVADRKASVEAKLTYFLFNVLAILQPVAHFLPAIPYKFPHVGISVFPAPLKFAKFGGQELYEMSFTMASIPLVLAVSILTYGDGLQFFCTGNNQIFTGEDVRQIVDDIEAELDRLEKGAVTISHNKSNLGTKPGSKRESYECRLDMPMSMSVD